MEVQKPSIKSFLSSNLLSSSVRASVRLSNLVNQIRPLRHDLHPSRAQAAEDELDVLIRRAEEMRIQEEKGILKIIKF